MSTSELEKIYTKNLWYSKTGEIHLVTDIVEMKIPDQPEWVVGIVYVKKSNKSLKYTMHIEEFKSRFSKFSDATNTSNDGRRRTLSGNPALNPTDPVAPSPINEETGQHDDYWTLSDAELKKGYVRPLRDTYVHVGNSPKYPLRDLTEEESQHYKNCGYVKYEEYPPEMSPRVGRFWTQEELDKKGCGEETIMAMRLAQTYATDPNFYVSTFCSVCKKHLPVSEFVWKGTEERVGS